MSRVIHTEGAGKERTKLSKAVVLALRELMLQTEPDERSKDLAAFIAMSLIKIYKLVNQSVIAWEKRGYWVKADRFRLEWEWTDKLGNQMREAVLDEDWATIAMISGQIGQKFSSVKVSTRSRIGKPWIGSWKALREESMQ